MDVIAPSTTPLDAARNELGRRTAAADRAGDWRERQVLSELESIADYTCRIGDNVHSTHYRAEKSSPLIRSALRLRQVALENYGDSDEALEAKLHEITKMQVELDEAIGAVLWTMTGHRELYRSDVAELRHRISALNAWAAGLDVLAVADPVD